MNLNAIELIFTASALLFNLLIAGVYIATQQANERWMSRFGKAFIALAVPFGMVLVDGLIAGREVWMLAVLGLTLVYILVELLLDFVWKIEFRKMFALHVPYLILFYSVLFGLIGFAFSINQTVGWLVSVTFWLLLASLIYMYLGMRKVGAQERRNRAF